MVMWPAPQPAPQPAPWPCHYLAATTLKHQISTTSTLVAIMSAVAWPPQDVSTPTVSAQDGVFATTGSAHINAPASFIFDMLLDTSTYSEWCTFVPRVVVDAQPSTTTCHGEGDKADDRSSVLKLGTKFTFFAVMGGPGSKQTSRHLIVSDISTPSDPSSYIPSATLDASSVYTADLSNVYRVAWKGDKIDIFALGLNTERFHELIVRGREQCEIRTWEVMGGVLAHTVKWLYRKTLNIKFSEWCEELKEYGEKKWTEEKQREVRAGPGES